MSERRAEEVVRLLNEVNSYAKLGCTFYLDTETYDVACAGRVPYSLLERVPDYAVDMIDGIWGFSHDIDDELMDVTQERLTHERRSKGCWAMAGVNDILLNKNGGYKYADNDVEHSKWRSRERMDF